MRNAVLPIMLQSIDSFVQIIASTPVDLDDDFFIRSDVADCFLSGATHEIADDAVDGWHSGAYKPLVNDVIHSLLFNQFVRSDQLPGGLWRVVRGSGMGLMHSCELMDYVLWLKAQTHITNDLCAWGIKGFWRYRDDILVHGSRSSRTRVWDAVRRLAQQAAYFKIKVEDVTYASGTFLNIDFFPVGRFYGTRPILKQTSLCRPLGEDSCHAPHLHKIWPCQLLRNYMRRCTTFDDQLEMRACFVRRFQTYGASKGLLDLLRQVSVRREVSISKAMPDHQHRQRWWVVLPYHPVIFQGVRRALRDLNSDPSLHSLFQNADGQPPPRLCVAWRNSVCSINTLFRPAKREVGWR